MKCKKIPVAVFIVVFISSQAYCQLWKQYADSAKAFNNKKETNKAIDFYNMAKKELSKDSSETFTYIGLCNELGNLYMLIRQFQNAEHIYLEVMGIRKKILGDNNTDYGASCYNLGNLYAQTNDFEKATSFYKKAMQIWTGTLGVEHRYYIMCSTNLAILYKKSGNYEEAETLFLENWKTCGRIYKDQPFYAYSCDNLANLYAETGRYKEAENLFLEVKNIREKNPGKTHPIYARTCENFANLYLYMEDYEKSELLFIEAKKIIAQSVGMENAEYATICSNLGGLYRALGQNEKARLSYEEAKQIREKTIGKKELDYAVSCSNLAVVYKSLGDVEKAEALYKESMQVTKDVLGKEQSYYALCCNNLAALYYYMGLYEKAEPLYREASNILERKLGKNHPDYALTHYNQAVLYAHMQQYDVAEPLFIEAKEIQQKILGKEHSDYIKTCSNLGNLYWNIKNNKQAQEYFNESVFMLRSKLKKIFQFTSEIEKQTYLMKYSGYEDSYLSFNKDAEHDVQKGDIFNIVLWRRNLILASSQHLRQIIYNAGDTGLKNRYDQWVNTREQLSFWYTKPVAERPLNFKDLEDRANTIEKELTRISSDFKKGLGSQEITWKEIQQNLENNEAAIEFIEFNYYDSKRWTDSTFYIALVLRKDKPEPVLINLFEKKQLDSLLKYKKTSPGQQKLNELYTGKTSTTTTLYSLIWEPLEAQLKGISSIYFATAGDLYKIAFAALPVNKTEVLSDRYRLYQLYTTGSVVNKITTGISVSDKIILYGGVQYDADSASIRKATVQYNGNDLVTRAIPEDLMREGANEFNYLPGSESEVSTIENLAKLKKYEATGYKGINATEESFKSLNGNNSPAVLHIATHGFFFPDPIDNKKDEKMGGAIVFRQSDNPLIRSGLALAGANNAWKGIPVDGVEDGILTSYEISNMYLPNTKLAVLSACETGLGDIQGSEGVYGLQRAFKMAGVQNLVMSLWRVDDKAASEFMQEFYKNLFAKQNINDAFYNAQVMMKTRYRNDPYKWAAWILVR
ncbi:MAG TPA: CHAT domain-containing protein [Chitinophagaceae bacterium]|nr:CHAT domain-containing protein [Chitinophagaceae bacterium]